MTSSMLSSHASIDKGLAPSYQPFKERYDLDSLVEDVKQHLGHSGGISSDEVDSEYLISLLKKYTSDPTDWISFFHNDTSKNYTRNAIENINHKANILLLVWNPGKGSPIHDHADAHCIMKVLAGQLHETVYHAPENKPGETKPLAVKSATTLGMNEVTYIADDIGLHRVHNPSSNQLAVSLHLYTPPNAADYGYNIFDEATGSASHVSQAHSVPKPQ
ncbi:DNA-directed RNA polymerase III subunit RPC2 [Penicillium atrosanguineum]|uniref:Cysteine dioxygenase n=1 Tax=Penicillium atrosanguineum TaxID=1132637 RepID=A0A9W9U2D6_9EURO|nr:DNA-directed RNA polymerase III subunit RPC2 [Penicillium atrosanguineum]KAJ5141102.1 Cysteine dioxygenase [Penicillium atrosanguineum]KAJ5290674.1 DNA-directed RNA polymerase III subunit RPC2 [Penicillium atrosanguineum]KAJ5308497.1 Cysteine dioxygenase [Penicillium atrosanguineum]